MSHSNTPKRENTAPLAIPRVLAALKDLIVVEETNEERIKLNNKVAWFHDVSHSSRAFVSLLVNAALLTSFCLKKYVGVSAQRIRKMQYYLFSSLIDSNERTDTKQICFLQTIPHAFKAVIMFTLWSTVVAVADLVYETSLNLSNSVVPLLSVVVGLMLVFRNTTAFARWEDGRKAFTSLQSAVRNTARDYWISIGAPVHTSNPKDPTPAPLPPKEIRLKARALRLLVAYVTAVKRHVRGQYGIDYEDLRALLPPEFYNRPSQPGFGFDAADADIKGSSSKVLHTESPPPLSGPLGGSSGSSSNTPSSDAIDGNLAQSTLKRRPAYQRVTSFFFSQKEELGLATGDDSVGVSDESSPLLRHRPSDQRMEDSSVVVVHNFLSRPSLPLPLVIAHQLHLYITRCKRKGYLEAIGPAGHSRMVASISTMTDLFSSIDGLGMTKIPACYCIHLKQCTTLYLWALPLTLASGKTSFSLSLLSSSQFNFIMACFMSVTVDLGWALIPFVSIVAFTLVGKLLRTKNKKQLQKS
jgi:putative membrane protein